MRIALFDDHPLILDSLSAFFAGQEEVVVAGTATNRADLLALLRSREVDMLVSDVLTEEEIGLELFADIQEMNLPLQVVVYSSIHSEFVKQLLYDYGVAAIVNKKDNPAVLWDTVQIVWLTTRYHRKDQIYDPPQLTDREKEIARYLAKGLVSKEIATLLGTSVNTINNQKNHLIAKFRCGNSVELVLKLTQMGYLRV